MSYTLKLTALVIFIVSSLYFYSFSLYGLNMWDECVAPVGAIRVLNGEKPVQDFKAYAPGRYYVLAWLFKTFGTSLEVFRYWMAVMTGLMAAWIFHILYTTCGRVESVFGTLLLLSAPAVYYNRFYGFSTLLILFFISLWIQSDFSTKYQWVFALSLSTAYLFKSEVSVMGAISYVCLVICNKKLREKPFSYKAAPIAIYFTSIILFYVIFHPNVPVSEFSYENIVKIFTLFSSWSTSFPSVNSLFDFSANFRFWEWFENWLFYIPIITYSAVTWKLVREGVNSRKNSMFLCASAMGFLTYSLVVWRTGLDNLIRCLPAFYIITAMLLGEALSSLRKKKNKRQLTAVLLIFFLGALFFVDMNVEHGYYVGSIGAVHEGFDKHLTLERGNVFVDDFQYTCIMQAEKMFKRIDANLTLLPLPFNPVWDFFLKRRNPLPYDWILPGEIDDVNRAWYIAKFKAKEPDSVILIDIPIDAIEERRFTNYAPEIYSIIREKYLPTTEFGPFQLYLKKAL